MKPLFIFFLTISFIITSIINPAVGAIRESSVYLPIPGSMVPLSPAFNPLVLKGIKVDPDNPFRFDFILDVGNGLKPFPPETFGQTDMGRDLLAQVYNSLILAVWFKKRMRDNILGRKYMDQNKIAGIDIEDKDAKQRIYEQYLIAFKKGVYNYIKEEIDLTTQQPIPKKYFSGGAELIDAGKVTEFSRAMTTEERMMIAKNKDNFNAVTVSLANQKAQTGERVQISTPDQAMNAVIPVSFITSLGSKQDSAQIAKLDQLMQKRNDLGGIDLTSKRMALDVESDLSMVSAPLDLKALENIEINALYIKNIEIKPLINLPELLGVVR